MSSGGPGAAGEPTEAYAWIWLPGAVEPVVAGRLRAEGGLLTFTYGRSYLHRAEAQPIFLPELPLQRGPIRPDAPLTVAGCIRDAGPDAWGQRVILARRSGRLDADADTGKLGLLTYLLDLIRKRFARPDETLRELFGRIVFNVCVSNTDDHARNHAAFYRYEPGGIDLALTPAYDLCPQPRSGDTAQQAMAIDRDGRRAGRLRICREAAAHYHLRDAEAADIIDAQVTIIAESWPDAAEQAELTQAERALLWQRQILNPAIHDDD